MTMACGMRANADFSQLRGLARWRKRRCDAVTHDRGDALLLRLALVQCDVGEADSLVLSEDTRNLVGDRVDD